MNQIPQTIAADGGYFFEKGGYRCSSMFQIERRIFLPSLAIIGGVVWFGFNRGLDWYWIALPGLIVFFMGASISWRYTLDPANGAVRGQAFLWGHRLLRETQIPFSSYKYVFVDNKGPEGQEFRVLLKHVSGRNLLVSHRGPTPRGAEELAWRISCDTGIKLKGDPG